MKFREAAGLTWMLVAFNWQVNEFPLLEMAMDISDLGDRVGFLIIAVLLVGAMSFGIGKIIGWPKDD